MHELREIVQQASFHPTSKPSAAGNPTWQCESSTHEFFLIIFAERHHIVNDGFPIAMFDCQSLIYSVNIVSSRKLKVKKTPSQLGVDC